MTEFNVGDKVFVDGSELGMGYFDPSVVREVFLHEQTGQLRVYDDEEISGEDEATGWCIDGIVIKPYVRHV